MSLDHKIRQTISLGIPALDRQGFGTVLILGAATFPERVKIYTADDDYGNDAGLTSDLKAALGIAFSQSWTPTRVAVGKYTSASESVTDALTACLQESSAWFGLCLISRADQDIEDAADWAEANERLYLAQSSDGDIPSSAGADIASVLMGKDYRMTAVAYYSNNTKYFDVGWLCGFLAKSFDERAPTAVYQTVQGIAPDVDNVGEQDHIESKNANYYSTLKGQGATFGGTVASGHDIEHIVTGLWVKARLSEEIAALFLAATDRGERIPYSDTGIAMFEQATYDVLKLGERIGHFNPGSSAVKMPRRADVAPADVQTGTLRYSWGAQYSGVIKEVSIQGYVSLEFGGFGE